MIQQQARASGLPSYTLPPTSGGRAGYSGASPSSRAPQPPWNTHGASYGVGAPGGSRQPFGGAAAPVNTPSAIPRAHGAGASGQPAGVPHQPAEGTVYGNESPFDMTMPVSMNALENSGSLTGHILAQGWDKGVDTNRRSNAKVAIAMLIVLLALVGVSMLFLFTAGDAFTDMVDGVFHQK
jgi:hypothetical protein